MTDPWEQVRTEVASAVSERAAAETELAAQQQRQIVLRRQATEAQARGDAAQASTLNAQADDAATQVLTLTGQSTALASGLLATISAALAATDIDLEPDVPLALLPVRLETRSMPGGSVLRVRIYPDELALTNVDTGASDLEAKAGAAYWTDRWQADATGDTAAADAAWARLLAAVGPRRAAVTAAATLPTNIAAKPAPGAPGDGAPVFPAAGSRRIRRSVIRTLPDRFVVVAEQGSGAALTFSRAPGSVIPDELPAGVLEGEAIDPSVAGLLAGDSRWLVDYQAAKDVGLGIDLTLEQPGVTINRLIAYGVRHTLDPEASAARLAELVTSHRLAAQAAVLAPGLPTNNTEAAPAGRDSAVPPPPPLAAAPPGQGAGAELETALGLPPGSLTELPGADRGWEVPASAMATVLWPATWETYLLNRVADSPSGRPPVLSADTRELLRQHATDTVRGLGPLPAIRLGKQPYGLLPVTSTTDFYAGDGSLAEGGLAAFMQRIRPLWQGAASQLSTVADADLETALPRILGTLSVSNGLRVRSVVPATPGLQTLANAASLAQAEAQGLVDELCSALMGVDPTRLEPTGLLATYTRVLGLPLADDSDPAVLSRLRAGEPIPDKPASVLQALAIVSAAQFETQRGRLIDVNEEIASLLPKEAIEGVPIPLDELREGLDRVAAGDDDPERTAKLADDVQNEVGLFDHALHAARFPLAALRPSAISAIPLNAQQQVNDRARLQVLGSFFALRSRVNDFNNALDVLSGTATTTQERALLLSATLDTTSHRLDAWLTSLATRRLREVRASRPTGILLGAYGWVENLAVRPPAEAGPGVVLPDPSDLPGGYVHAPGIAHAGAAAVLRSGRMSAMRRGSAAFDLDLSSSRVRQARAVLEGAGGGQSVGALLGYRFERHLLTHGAERWVYPMRAIAPIRAGKLTDAGSPSESVAASEVCDGVQLLELSLADLIAKAQAWKPNSGGDTYLDAASWTPMVPDEQSAIGGAYALIADLRDAAADLLLAESVHALVQGSPARAAAAADAAAAGEAPPPELQLLQSDRAGVAVTHRLLVLLDRTDPLPGYALTRPRASAEPRLEGWLQQQLGPATQIVLRDASPDGPAVTLDAAGVCALDLVLGAASAGVGGTGGVGLEAETPLTAALRQAAGGALLDRRPDGWAGTDPRLAIGEAWELARALAAVLASARPVDASDLGQPGGTGADARLADPVTLSAGIRKTRDTLTQDKNHLAALLPGPADPPPDAATRDSISDYLEQLAGYGIGPGKLTPSGDADADLGALLIAARASVAAAEARLDTATADITLASDPETEPAAAVGAWRRAAQDLLGSGFPLLPVLAPANGDGASDDMFSAALGSPVLSAGEVASRVRPWLLRVASVRPAVARWTQTLLYRDALGRGPTLRVAQVPLGGSPSWLGAALAPDQMPVGPVADVIAETPDPAGTYVNTRLSGFVVDTWVDTIPRRRVLATTVTPDGVAPAPEPIATTGIAVNANAPNNEAPQAILLALSPDRQRWDSDRLVAVLHETMDLMRLRGVTLETLPWVGRLLPAAYVADWSLQGEPTIDPAFLHEAISVTATPHFVRGS
jgi:hypothetical protein